MGMDELVKRKILGPRAGVCPVCGRVGCVHWSGREGGLVCSTCGEDDAIMDGDPTKDKDIPARRTARKAGEEETCESMAVCPELVPA
ncbi:MAG: hypothetical protein DRJ56_06040 [Thermoprotei archaeon]|nr:MAG: hypothetical protein DRJ56_06040 [Thermoprotei archaeon]